MKKPRVLIVGGGSAALFLCAHIDTEKYDVHLYEKTSKVGRKFLVAGNGGFNLTHGSNIEDMKDHYMPKSRLEDVLGMYSNIHLRDFLRSLGIETFVGSSNRVFPIGGIKPYEVLQRLLTEIDKKGVNILTDHEWKGFGNDKQLLFEHGVVDYDYAVFALGGGSWSKTGSDGSWITLFENAGIKVNPLEPSNVGVMVQWNDEMKLLGGKPIKNIGIKVLDQYVRGEALITDYGLEGGAIYAMSRSIKTEMKEGGPIIYIDLKPDWTIEKLISALDNRSSSITKTLKSKINLSDTKLKLLRAFTSKETFMDPNALARCIKTLPLIIDRLAPIDEAISTSGGISFDEIDYHFQLKDKSGVFTIGEMVDWDTITGGYLLQGCYSMAHQVAEYLNKYHNK